MTKHNLRIFRRIINAMLALILVFGLSRTVLAQDGGETAVSAVDTVWVLFAAFLVFFMQAGFGFLEAGFVRSKNVVNIMAENLMDTTMTTMGFIILGFGLMFSSGNGFIGTEWFFLNGMPDIYPGLTIPTLAFFFFQFAFCAAASTIASGLMAERTDFKADLAYSFLTGLIIYPIFGHWVWGGGWLAEMGYMDFAGSSVVHLVGAYVGLAGTIMLGKRKDKKFGHTIRGHNIALAALGTFILWLGWFGFNPGSQLNAEPGAISLIVVTTDFAATTGAITAMALAYIYTRKWDVSMAFNGALGGLVAITAPCAFVTPQAALMIGIFAGVITYFGVDLMEKLRIDDPVGAFPVHGLNGIFGTLAIGIWATDGVGLLHGGGLTQLGIQAIGLVACTLWTLPLAFVMFFVIDKVIGLRVKPEVEDAGIDESYHGIGSYPEFINNDGTKELAGLSGAIPSATD
ncbi:MAG: ammonium transporter [Ardenticatenaceae bacterium]|nr:ammonium transporter [Ardenticatenaceae bacterium]MCB8991033.1 ammonium transporter [Ardenticatenaceae bacterium]